MSDVLLTVLYSAAGVAGVIFWGIVTNALWEWLRDTASYRLQAYIDVRGTWEAEIVLRKPDGEEINYKESWFIKQQFGKRFSGVITFPHPNGAEQATDLSFRGEFKDKYHAILSYEHRSSSLTDFGAGMLQFGADHAVAEGGSINFGVSSPNGPAVVTCVARKSRRPTQRVK